MKRAVLILITFFCSVVYANTSEQILQKEIARLQSVYAPDGRTSVFNIKIRGTKQIEIVGETSVSIAYEELMNFLKRKHISAYVEIDLLPSPALKGKVHAIACKPICNNRAFPNQGTELTTQMLLGVHVDVLKKYDNWYLIRTPDAYLSWVDESSIVLMNASEFDKWRKKPKVIFDDKAGASYTAPNFSASKVTELVNGNILALVSETDDFYKVAYPDGTVAYVSKDQALPLLEWLNEKKFDIREIVASAKSLLGTPYLWGGTSIKAVDCSGFIKTIYFDNGFVLPRDASQQAQIGYDIDVYENGKPSVSKCLKVLQKGDLIFFTSWKNKEKNKNSPVTHVGMYLGNGEFIHSSGRVKISSIIKGSPNFAAKQSNTLIKAKRLSNEILKRINYEQY